MCQHCYDMDPDQSRLGFACDLIDEAEWLLDRESCTLPVERHEESGRDWTEDIPY